MAASSRREAKAEEDTERLSPGAHLRNEFQRIGLDQIAVSKATGVSRQSINNIINDRQAISRAMAGKLGRLTGHSSDYWLSAYFSKAGHAVARTDQPDRTTGPLVDHQIVAAHRQGLIGIDPFAAHHVRTASIDLTLHNTINTADGDIKAIDRGKGFLLKPGQAIIASTRERIELPLDYLGRIGIVSSLASLGIIASHAIQIEPGYRGPVAFCLLNSGGSACRLRAHEPVITLEISRLAVAALGPATPRTT